MKAEWQEGKNGATVDLRVASLEIRTLSDSTDCGTSKSWRLLVVTALVCCTLYDAGLNWRVYQRAISQNGPYEMERSWFRKRATCKGINRYCAHLLSVTARSTHPLSNQQMLQWF